MPRQTRPIYQQMQRTLRTLISDDYAIGDRFLSERQISERFDVSRPTANKVLASLMAEGLLTYRKGVGTFVAEPVLGYDLQALISFTEQATRLGKTPASRVLRCAPCAVEALPEPAAAVLDGDCYAIERVRLADDQPVIVEQRFLVQEHCPDLAADDLAGSLYALFVDRYDLRIGGARQIMRAVAASQTEATALAIAVGSPVMAVEAIGYLADGQALWWEHTCYRGDAYEFRSQLGCIGDGAPPSGHLIG